MHLKNFLFCSKEVLMLPKHGTINCRLCFGASDGNMRKPNPNWKMINDPGAWGGGADPEYLVLGFSKGKTQTGIYESGMFEDVAFSGMRSRLTAALRAMGALTSHECVGSKIADPDSNIAFGSLIRCSVSRIDKAAEGKEVYSCSGPLITRSFTEIHEVIDNCTRRFLTDMPASVRVVFFLGNTDSYVTKCQSILRKLFPDGFKQINAMAAYANSRVWVNIAHPSGSNGHFNTWLKEDCGAGLKRIQAKDAIDMGVDNSFKQTPLRGTA
jgi:hypothetical protein